MNKNEHLEAFKKLSSAKVDNFFGIDRSKDTTIEQIAGKKAVLIPPDTLAKIINKIPEILENSEFKDYSEDIQILLMDGNAIQNVKGMMLGFR